MKLNLGCGQYKLAGYLNLDSSPVCEPDQVLDLEQLPWPFPDNSCEDMVLSHVLEHLGERLETYLGIWKEIYRVCAPQALVKVTVPHPRHDLFLIDPTHIRPILPESLMMLSKARNLEWKQNGVADTPLGLYLDVDFEVTDVRYVFDAFWASQIQSGKMKEQEVMTISRTYNNVIQETVIEMKALKNA